MPPDPPRRASLCPGVKAVFPLVQNLNETPVPLRMYGMHRTQCDHVRSDLLPREAYVKHGFGEGAFTQISPAFPSLWFPLVITSRRYETFLRCCLNK